MRETAAQMIARAAALRQRDRLAHLWADMAVAMAMEQMRCEGGDELAERRPRQFAHDVATLATTILVAELITKDGAVATLRAELEAHKQQLSKLLELTPAPIHIRTITEGESK